jgi:hypothetical protein
MGGFYASIPPYYFIVCTGKLYIINVGECPIPRRLVRDFE